MYEKMMYTESCQSLKSEWCQEVRLEGLAPLIAPLIARDQDHGPRFPDQAEVAFSTITLRRTFHYMLMRQVGMHSVMRVKYNCTLTMELSYQIRLRL